MLIFEKIVVFPRKQKQINPDQILTLVDLSLQNSKFASKTLLSEFEESNGEKKNNPKNLNFLLKNPLKISSGVKVMQNSWTFEDRELLKKSLFSFGYGRWTSIQKYFQEHKGGLNAAKTIQEIRAYSNSLIKSIADNLSFKNFELKALLLSMIQQPK